MKTTMQRRATKCASCGAEWTAKEREACGYATDKRRRRICTACAGVREIRAMRATGRAILYLTAPKGASYRGPCGTIIPGIVSGAGWELTGCTGLPHFNVHRARRSRVYGLGSWIEQRSCLFIGPDGYEWIAVSRGDMDAARCRRTARFIGNPPAGDRIGKVGGFRTSPR